MDFTDNTRPIRSGEEFDIQKVETFLKDSIQGLQGPMAVTQFPGGHSNLTYLIKFDNREMVFRRPPFGRKAKTAHDMHREYRILKALRPAFPYCPEPLAYTEDESIIGCPFYVMERIRGIILRKDIPAGLTFASQEFRQLCEKLIDVHVQLHSIDYKAIGLENFGKPVGYVKRQVEGWSERFRNARTPDAPDYERIMAWLYEKMPPDCTKSSVIHNDYRFDNVVLDPNDPLKIIGVLDWEMATVGDPLMDLGGSLAYWVEKDDPPNAHVLRMAPTTVEGALTRKEVINRYSKGMGIPIVNFDFYHCFGLFRLAVIAQQIYYRFYHGQTKDERFKIMIVGVQVLEEAAAALIDQSKL